jgi:hypothetical protein
MHGYVRRDPSQPSRKASVRVVYSNNNNDQQIPPAHPPVHPPVQARRGHVRSHSSQMSVMYSNEHIQQLVPLAREAPPKRGHVRSASHMSEQFAQSVRTRSAQSDLGRASSGVSTGASRTSNSYGAEEQYMGHGSAHGSGHVSAHGSGHVSARAPSARSHSSDDMAAPSGVSTGASRTFNSYGAEEQYMGPGSGHVSARAPSTRTHSYDDMAVPSVPKEPPPPSANLVFREDGHPAFVESPSNPLPIAGPHDLSTAMLLGQPLVCSHCGQPPLLLSTPVHSQL